MIRRTGSQYAPCLAAVLLGAWLAAGCGSSSPVILPPPGPAAVEVRDTAGSPVAGATVFLVPAGDVDGARITGADILSGDSEDRDEPLEDTVRLRGQAYLQAVTDGSGLAYLPSPPEGSYFVFVAPAPADIEHLPGGSACRLALDWTVLTSRTTRVTMSSQPGAQAAYVGSSRCLACHDHDEQSTHAHRLGFAVPGQFSAMQDDTRYPDYRKGWDQYLPAAGYAGGTVVYFSDFDASRGFDKFKTTTTDPTPAGGTVYVRAWLWRDLADGTYKITLENVRTPADPRTPWTLEVGLTYGGAVYKQRNLVRVPGRKGLYPLLQYQTSGNDGRYDRTRKAFRDYHLDWFWDAGNDLFQDPPLTKNFEGNCMACHATGFERYQDPGTMEWLSHAVDDPNGAYDLDGDGSLDEINVGCEVCHGPGSEHAAWAADPARDGAEGRYIVSPRNLSPSREMMICGRCHGRELGNGSLPNDEPLNANNEMMRVGRSRHEYLTAGFVQRKGPAPSSMWSDDLHSKSHHQQYSDLLKSSKHRNGRILVTCGDCHDSHGESPYEHHLKADPSDTRSGLCAMCHFFDLTQHMLEKTGSTHRGNATSCFLCHMTTAAKSGAGVYGQLLAPPTGGMGDDDVVFYKNDISSHLFLHIPRKTHQDVAGQTPSSAMPIPYTNACGAPCHDASQLPFLKPGSVGLRRIRAFATDDPKPVAEGHEVDGHEVDDYGSD